MNKLNLLNKLESIDLDKKKIILVGVIFLLVIYIDFTYLLKLQLKGIKTLNPKIIKLKKDINNLTKDSAIIQDLKGKSLKGTTGGGTLKVKKIISPDQLPQLLQDISDVANANQVKLINLTKISPSKDAKSDEERISLDLTCDYHHFGAFINALENAGKFMSMEEIKITSDPANYFQQNVKLVLKIYVKK